MALGDRGAAALSLACAPSQPRHLGRGAGLIDEDEPFPIEIKLGFRITSGGFHIRALLFAGVCPLFMRDWKAGFVDRQT
jgi:hypothetical protein